MIVYLWSKVKFEGVRHRSSCLASGLKEKVVHSWSGSSWHIDWATVR